MSTGVHVLLGLFIVTFALDLYGSDTLLLEIGWINGTLELFLLIAIYTGIEYALDHIAD